MNISKDYELTSADICKIIQENQCRQLKLKTLRKSYEGQHDILNRPCPDPTKSYNKLIYNFPQYIADNFSSYMTGNQITYKGDSSEDINGIMNYNDSGAVDSEISLDMNIYGEAYELHYMDSDSKQRFKRVSPEEMIIVHDDTIENNIAYAIRPIVYVGVNGDKNCIVEVYDNKKVTTYESDELFSTISPIEEIEHFYNDVPVVEYLDKSSFENVISLVDAYEKLSSAEVDDYEAFVDAYMVLKGMTAEAEDIQQMKENRVLLLDDGADAKYLTKDVNSQQIENIKKELVENIHKLSCCPNFADESFGTSSGIAMKYKLLGFTNAAQNKIRNMKKGIQRRLELICNILSLPSTKIDYRSIEVVFTPNLPVDELSSVQMVNQLRGLVSDETLLSILPFIEDVQVELEKLGQQNSKEYDFEV